MSGAIAARHWPGDPARPALALHCSMGSSSYWGPVAERLDGGQIARALLARLPHGTERVVAGAAHMLPITHPEAVAAAVAENLARG